jgi:hypothetical protein
MAPSPKTRTLNRSGSNDGSSPDETMLELPTGSNVRHHAWYRSFSGWVVAVDVTAGPHGDARFSIETGMRERSEAIMPTSATTEAARDFPSVGASVERLAQFVDVPDPLERLRVLTATKRLP